MLIPAYDDSMGRREEILAATRDLIVEEGLETLSFSKIFARAGVGSGTVYNYFSSKEELVSTLYRETADFLDREVLTGYDPTAGLKERFRSMLVKMARFVPAHRKELKLLAACHHSPYVAQELRYRPLSSEQAAASLLSEGQTNGTFLPMNPDMAFRLISGAITAVVEAQLDGKLPFDEEVLDQAIEACWRAVAAPGQ